MLVKVKPGMNYRFGMNAFQIAQSVGNERYMFVALSDSKSTCEKAIEMGTCKWDGWQHTRCLCHQAGARLRRT